jgi:hypothetical protein
MKFLNSSALHSKHLNPSLSNRALVVSNIVWTALLIAFLLALFCSAASQAWAAPASKPKRMQTPAVTATALATSSATVNQKPIIVLSATVTDPNPVMQGLVHFYDGKTLLGASQIVNTGSAYTHGTANLKIQLSPGTHVLKAVFAGTTTDAMSASSTKSVTVSGGTSATTISATGKAGDYMLTGQVVTSGPNPATGTVSFVDQTNSNAVIGSSNLGVGTVASKFAKSVPYSIYDPTDYHMPQEVVVADFNGDGILDFAEVNYSAGISIHLGNGDGTFQPATPFCTTGTPPSPCQAGSEPVAIAVGDFNSDGIPDLVVQDGSNVDVMIGNGDGTFQPQVAYSTASGNTQIVVGDFNMDGTPDLAVAVSGGVSILIGNGDGTFQPNNDIALNDSSTYLTVGDFNKDGIQDLAVTGWNGSNIMVLLGNGDGSFQSEKDTPIDINPAAGTIVAADFKGLGYLCDLAISGGALEAMVGKGDGTFNAPQELKADSTFSVYNGAFAVADLNGDGIPDMALTWYSSDTAVGRVAVFFGKGDGTFNATPTQLSVGEEPIWVATGDFDGNGTTDLVVVNDNDDTLSVVLNSATTTASAVLANVTIPGSGTHQVVAQYAGNTAFGSSTSTAIPLTAGGTAPAPALTSLSPVTAVAGGAAFTLTVNGSNFATGAVVKWNGSARTTAFVSATKLNAAILAADIATAGAYPVTVSNTTGNASNALTFTVTAPVVLPVLTSISPNDMPAGGSAFTLSVNGSNFVSGTTGSIVYWNTAKLPTTFVNATRLTATVPAADIATSGSASITVKNGTGTASNALTFTMTSPAETPIAMGFFSLTGAAGATSGNIDCTWSTSEYLCTITGQTFFYSKYVANATVADIDSPAVATVNSIGGKIVVKIYNLSGTAIQAPFYITVYKP